MAPFFAPLEAAKPSDDRRHVARPLKPTPDLPYKLTYVPPPRLAAAPHTLLCSCKSHMLLARTGTPRMSTAGGCSWWCSMAATAQHSARCGHVPGTRRAGCRVLEDDTTVPDAAPFLFVRGFQQLFTFGLLFL